MDIKPVIHEMPPPYGPYGGINFSGVVMFDLVIDADGNVLAALPKAVDGMCSCKLESLVEHRIKPLGAALLRWKFSAQKPIQRDELVVLEMPIDFQKAQDRQ